MKLKSTPSRPRPPMLAIALLVLFTGLVLGVVTLRQLRTAETRRLRLLAGFAERIESTVGDYTEHLSEVLVRLGEAPQPLDAAQAGGGNGKSPPEPTPEELLYSDLVHLRPSYVDVQQRGDETPPHADAQLSLDASGYDGFVTYRGPLPAMLARDRGRTREGGLDPQQRPDPPLIAAEDGLAEGEGPGSAGGAGVAAGIADLGQPNRETRHFDGDWQVTLAINLEPALTRIGRSNLFDSVIIADLDGEVLIQDGEPELRTATLVPFLERRLRTRDGPGAAREDGAGDGGSTRGPPGGRLEAAVESMEVSVAGRRYQLFLQPISIELPRLEGDAKPRTVRWLAGGLVAGDRLLTGSATSPLLLGILFATFPLGLILWPFLKLWLTSSRQPFTRFDSASLVLSTLLSVALLTLLLLGLSTTFQHQRIRDRQLQSLSERVQEAFWLEIGNALQALEHLNSTQPIADSAGTSPEGDTDGKDAKLPSFWLPDLESWRAHCEANLSVPCPQSDEDYSAFSSVFWVNRNGVQQSKIALSSSGGSRNRVDDRGYFWCVVDPRVRSDAVQVAPLPAQTAAGALPALPQFCLQSILSKTSRESLAAIAIEGPTRDLPVAVLTTRLWSVAEPVLAPGFRLAILDDRGRVMFHSDPSRNLVESFFKAADEDRLLLSIMEARRSGLLSFTYWGRSQRAYVQPLEGLPWTLVVFAELRPLRLRVLETLYDFFNAFLLYTVALSTIGFLFIAFLPGHLLEPLWPDGSLLVPYELLLLASILLIGGFAFVLAHGAPVWICVTAVAMPLLLLLAAGGVLHFAAKPTSRWRNVDATARGWIVTRWALAGATTLVALLALVESAAREPVAGSAPRVAATLLLLAAGVALAGNLPLPKPKPPKSPRPAGGGDAPAGEPAVDIEPSTPETSGMPPLPRLRRAHPAALTISGLLVLAALGSLATRFRESPGVPILAITVFVLLVAWIHQRHQFLLADTAQGGKKRRFAYLLMLGSVLALLSILPTVGFFEIARARQLELLVQEHQLGLAASLENRSRGLPAGRVAAKAAPYYGQSQDTYLEVFFDSVLDAGDGSRSPVECAECGDVSAQPSWAEASRRTPAPRVGGAVDPATEPGPFLRTIARYFSSRPVPVSDPSAQPVGVDLSRFGDERAVSFRRCRVLSTAVRTGHGTGEPTRIHSCLAPTPAFPAAEPELPAVVVEGSAAGSAEPRRASAAARTGAWHWGVPQLGLLLLLAGVLPLAPIGLAYLISHDVLLITLVRPSRSQGEPDGAAVERKEKSPAGAPPHPEEADTSGPLLRLNDLPERVVQELKKEQPAAAATIERILERVGEAHSPTSKLPRRPQRILILTSVPDLALERVRSKVSTAPPGESQFEVIEFSELLDPEARRPADRTDSRTPVILTHFQPETEDEERGREQLRRLQRILEVERRSVVIVSQAEPRGFLGQATPKADSDSEASSLQRRWEGFLASFVIEYGRDEASQDTALLPSVLYKLRRLVDRNATLNPTLVGKMSLSEGRLDLDPLRECMRHDLADLLAEPRILTPDQRHQLALLTLIYRECSPTRHLQGIGRMLVDDVEDPALTRQRLTSRIGYLARPYYQAIWASLDTDARVVLYHMAEHGVANPKAFDQILDLLQRGIVVRDPALRPMNSSFRRFVQQVVAHSRVLAWEGEAGTSAWSVLKWLLPLPLLLLGGFLYITQRDSFSSLVGFVVALGSIAPILTNLYGYFEHAVARRTQARQDRGGAETTAEPAGGQ